MYKCCTSTTVFNFYVHIYFYFIMVHNCLKFDQSVLLVACIGIGSKSRYVAMYMTNQLFIILCAATLIHTTQIEKIYAVLEQPNILLKQSTCSTAAVSNLVYVTDSSSYVHMFVYDLYIICILIWLSIAT